MRRAEKEIQDRQEIEGILQEAQICRIAVVEGNRPYIVPMNFGYADGCLYLHSAKEGKKIEILKQNNQVCFEVETRTEVVPAENPCKWGMKFRSVIGQGLAEFIESPEEKRQALDVIMSKYSDQCCFTYQDAALERIAVIKVEVAELTGKKSG